MDTALGFIETGPSSGAFVFTSGGGASAMGATDGAIAFGGEGVGGNVVLLEVGLNLIFRPSGHGIEFEDVAVSNDVEVVEFEELDV